MAVGPSTGGTGGGLGSSNQQHSAIHVDPTELAAQGIKALAPPATGWLLAFVLMTIFMITASGYQSLQRMAALERLLIMLEEDRSAEINSYHEMSRHLIESMARIIETQASTIADNTPFTPYGATP